MALIASPRSEYSPAADIALGIGEALVLDAPPRLLAAASGRVELYGMVGETRCFLAAFGEGAAFLTAGDERFAVVAPEGAQLCALEPQNEEQEAEIIDIWLRALTEGLARYAPARPELTSILAGETAALREGDALSAGRGVCWLRGALETSLFLGVTPAPRDLLPLSPAVWIVAQAP